MTARVEAAGEEVGLKMEKEEKREFQDASTFLSADDYLEDCDFIPFSEGMLEKVDNESISSSESEKTNERDERDIEDMIKNGDLACLEMLIDSVLEVLHSALDNASDEDYNPSISMLCKLVEELIDCKTFKEGRENVVLFLERMDTCLAGRVIGHCRRAGTKLYFCEAV